MRSQLGEELGRLPTQAEVDTGVELLKEAGGFHARHIWPDWFYRRAVVALIRSPTQELVEHVRNFFKACNAEPLVNHIDNMVGRLTNDTTGRNWSQVLGKDNVRRLRNDLSNVPGLLFSGHRSGNFEAGTQQDITEDTIFQMGQERIDEINRTGVALLESLSMDPFIDVINDQLCIQYTNSVMNLTGPTNSRRTQETRVSPTTGLGSFQSARVLARSPFYIQLRYACVFHPRKTAVLFIAVIVVIWMRLMSTDSAN